MRGDVLPVIAFAKGHQLPALQAMWRRCFGDGEEYTAFVFRHLLCPQNILVCSDEEERPQGMLCQYPMTLSGPGYSCKSAYIFGVATLPEHRGRGISTKLLEAAHRYLKMEKTAASVLVPASEGLFRFYGQRGYQNAFSIVKEHYPAAALSPTGLGCVLIPAAFETLHERRLKHYGASRMLAGWGEDYLRFIGGECSFTGGRVLKTLCEGEAGYAVCYRGEDHVVIKELAVDPEHLQSVLWAIHRRFGAREYTVYLPSDFVPESGNPVLPFGMIQWYDKKKRKMMEAAGGRAPYLAHALD